jgi:hypothetical protein
LLSSPPGKNIPLPVWRKSVAYARRLVPKEGRLAIVTDVGNGMRWTLMARLTKRAEADGEVVWAIFWHSVEHAETKKTL